MVGAKVLGLRALSLLPLAQMSGSETWVTSLLIFKSTLSNKISRGVRVYCVRESGQMFLCMNLLSSLLILRLKHEMASDDSGVSAVDALLRDCVDSTLSPF